MIPQHVPVLTGGTCASGGEGLMTRVTVEPPRCILETTVRLYIDDTLIKKKDTKCHLSV